MRIDRIEIENFKKFSRQSFSLHPQFTLFAGENGVGKTTVLDALAVSAGVWLVKPPEAALRGGRREIAPSEIRLEAETKGDRVQFRERRPVRVRATGQIGDRAEIAWVRQIRESGKRTTNQDAKVALDCIQDIFTRDGAGEDVLCPVLAYYGAGRAWLPSNDRVPRSNKNGRALRWAAFYDCFNERIRFPDLQQWFQRESIERGNRSGRWRPGFEVVRRAILGCVPGAEDVYFDSDRDQIVLSILGNLQPFDNLSAGQRMMLAMVADLAIKAVTQNAFLIPPDDLGPSGLPEVLRRTPGLILIDELDVHLHPRWQRRVARDLKATFPAMQFVCTSHSPQVIGELLPEEVRLLDGHAASTPERSFGMDSNSVLKELMNAEERNGSIDELLRRLFALIDKEDFAGARALLLDVESQLGADDPEVTRARALMSFLESPA
jgi:predicted ATP-binding protein involved in virulence